MSELRVLVVDDTNFFQEMARGFLRQSAAAVFTARNGAEALKAARKIRPHLVYMDLYMPEMDGAACCAALKADPHLKETPVIMIYSHHREEDADICREAGCDALLPKPVDRKSFLNAGRAFMKEIERRERRILCRATVMCRADDATFYGTIEDISETGMFVGSTYTLKMGERVLMSFLIPGKGETVIEATAQVVWVNGKKSRTSQRLAPGFGVEFLEMADEARESIGIFVAHNILRHHIPDDELLERPRL
jgi:CheY-like chemotaxis protein/Tfp pilus assembly protein PilZ